MTADRDSAIAPVKGTEVVFTTDPASRRFALDEVLGTAPGSELVRWLAPDVGLVSLVTSWDVLVAIFREQPPIFCRHIFPVRLHVAIDQAPADLDLLADAAARLAPEFDPDRPFSVQTRLLDEGWPYGPYDVNTRLADVWVAAGGTLDVRQPEQVLSVVLTAREGYVGRSPVSENLSDWAGGARRFRREKGQISRAEFKLLEALEVFELQVPEGGVALDLGAAPGGWTRILRRHGMRVVAVDPADLVPALAQDPDVHHVRALAQDALPGIETAFDVVLNDMRVDARDSARLMLRAAANLEPTGWALMTLKLPKHSLIGTMKGALDVLGAAYTVTGVRQLFHNRSEVTVALRRKGTPA